MWAFAGEQNGWQAADTTSPSFVNTLAGTTPGLGYWLVPNKEVALTLAPPMPTEIAYYHADHLGSTNLVTDSAGEIVSETAYYPFGVVRHEHLAKPTEFDPHYRFSDKERDEESGLYYFGARYLAPWLARWVSCDPAGAVDGLNPYAYVGQQPLSRVDRDGLQGQDATRQLPRPCSRARCAIFP